MRKIIPFTVHTLCATAAVALALYSCSATSSKGKHDSASAVEPPAHAESSAESAPSAAGEMTLPASQSGSAASAKINGAARLKAAYPDKIADVKDNYVYFKDGTKIVYDDGRKKDFVTMLDESDPEDMFFVEYDTTSAVPGYLNDCGRSRCEALFKKLYGNSQQAVSRQLTKVDWFGQKISFSSSNGAARQLAKVRDELAKRPELRKYLTGASTFYWRPVRGAKRLSAHSYGMAVDINTTYSDYWLWKNPKAGELGKFKYVNRIPLEVVKVFEKYGFVWGGRWYHYDTMHFEYRPELNPPRA